MTEPTGGLPTREELAEILFNTTAWFQTLHGIRDGYVQEWAQLGADDLARDEAFAAVDALLARLRPAWAQLEAHYRALDTSPQVLQENDALRAALAQKEADLKACAEQLRRHAAYVHEILNHHGDWEACGSTSCDEARAALARPGVRAATAPAPSAEADRESR